MPSFVSRNLNILRNKLNFRILQFVSFKIIYYLSAFFEFGSHLNFQKWAQVDPFRESHF